PPQPYLTSLIVKSPADRPDLHSFPTRRSSDLWCCAASRTSRRRPRLVRKCSATSPRRARRPCCCWSRERAHRPIRSSRAERLRSDRKSTRLNSSHVATSYAVFCLKKKIVYNSGGGRDEYAVGVLLQTLELAREVGVGGARRGCTVVSAEQHDGV